MEEGGWASLTVAGIAARAGVGKQTLYRWWDGDLGRIVVETYLEASDERVEPPDTGSVRDDLVAVVTAVAALGPDRDRGLPLANRSLMAHAQVHPGFAEQYAALHRHWRQPMLDAVARGVGRGELAPDTDADLVVDLLLGLQWYRLLVGHLATTPAEAELSVDVALARYSV